MKLLWTTDPHFDHATASAWQTWIDQIATAEVDGLIVTGDVTEADDLVARLRQIADRTGRQVYVVLGNHDFYGGSIAHTRRMMVNLAREDDRITYLTDCDPIPIDPDVFLVGEDGWGDATIGDFDASPIRLHDFSRITDFADMPAIHWRKQLTQLGRESADRLSVKLDGLPRTCRAVLVATHVPPFREACWYEGQTTNDDWAPFFVCGQVGDALQRFANQRPAVQVTVICGHTHHGGLAKMSDNLVVRTGSSVYGSPGVEAQIQFDGSAAIPDRIRLQPE
ncbi:Calcineurin-like phosphoesterase superfamily domain protein [Rubripirellula lacrimiformis]|uniref:Calcineurin-like phosphoesterase superfamily domain protein n=1 Tax=Rubripirellula lacrimiformis TaxID=1930273 RepID=A0A517N3E0_9BACT|nr:Calcineurin-like phosphoesterase superfamily domain protein [Rubripirellula lacrimiformis]